MATHGALERKARVMIKALPSSRCSKGFLCPAVGILPGLVSRPLGCFGVQRVDDGCGVVVDYCEERPCWGLRLAAAGFPILHVVEAETERDGELGLRETEAFADGLHIDLSGEGGLVAFGISLEVGLDFAKSVHEFVECGGHGLSLPVCVENSVCAFLKFVSLCLGKIGFLVLRKGRDEEGRKPLIAPDVNNASAPAFSHALAGNTNLPVIEAVGDLDGFVLGVISGVNAVDDCLRSIDREVAMEFHHSVSGIDQIRPLHLDFIIVLSAAE